MNKEFLYHLLLLAWVLLVAATIANAMFHPSMMSVTSAIFNSFLLWTFGPRNK